MVYESLLNATNSPLYVDVRKHSLRPLRSIQNVFKVARKAFQWRKQNNATDMDIKELELIKPCNVA